MMDRPFSEILEAYAVASRSNDPERAGEFERELIDRCAETALFLTRSAELDVEAGQILLAAKKWAALAILRPNDRGVFRQEVNALTRQGDIDIGFRRLKTQDLLESGFEHFYWGLHRLIAAGDWGAAEELVRKAREQALLSPAEMTLSKALLLLETGMDLAAETLLRDLSNDVSSGGQHGRRLLARLMGQRGEYDAAALAYGELALATGSMGDLNASVLLHELLMRYDIALQTIDAAVLKWPALKAGAAPMSGRLVDLRNKARQAVLEHGPLATCESSRVLQWIHSGRTETQILWARQALMHMADHGSLPIEKAEEFLRPFGAWEEWRINRHIGRCYLRQFPDDSKLLHRYIRTVALDANQREGLVELLNKMPADATDADMLLYAIHVLRQLEYAVPDVKLRMALPMEELRAKVQRAIPATEVNFRIHATGQLRQLGIELPAIDLTDVELSARRTVQQAAIFASATWNSGIVRQRLSMPQREASVVVAISGQMRGFERSWPSVHDYLVKPLRAPVAISLWDTSRNALGRHAKRLERTLPPDLLALLPPLERFTDVFQRKFPRSAAMLFDKVSVDPKDIEGLVSAAGVKEYFIETESEARYEATIIENSSVSTHSLLKMFAKFHRMEQIVAEMESNRGAAFTHVCWIRPDARISRFSRTELDRWMQDFDNGWGEAVRPNTVGDYILFLPRRMFAVLARIFPSVILSGGLEFLGWRPLPMSRFSRDSTNWGMGGPETIAAALFAAGITLREIRCVQIELMGYVPPNADFRRCFLEEYAMQ